MFELRGVAKHFITVPTGNCNFVFRRPSINVSLGFVLRRIEGPGQTKVTILLGASQGPNTWCNIAGNINPNVLTISELPVLCASVSKQVFVPNLLFENELIDLYENEPVGVTHSHIFRIGFAQKLMLKQA